MSIPPSDGGRRPDRWARFRFSVIAPLLATPLERGQLDAEIRALAARLWRHPISGQPVRFSRSAIERWYYLARAAEADPMGALCRRVRADRGSRRCLSAGLLEQLLLQYRAHPGWSFQLHHDNLRVLVERQPEIGPMPSYSALRRSMRASGLVQQRRPRVSLDTAGAERARQRLAEFEVRSYEAAWPGQMSHSDFHEGSRAVVTPDGKLVRPVLLGVLDDHSRLACHVQWYLEETARTFVHGLSQAFEKWGLPRALMTDNGSPMCAAETTGGLECLGIAHERTLAYSPYQNGKQEVFWAQVEGRLLPMLEGVEVLELEILNRATLAWVEYEYNRKPHSELGVSPLERFLASRSMMRPCPDAAALRRAFRVVVRRTQRRSDGTLSLAARRYEVPARFRHLPHIHVAYATWDLGHVEMVDPLTGRGLARLPLLDKQANADGRRRRLPEAARTPLSHPAPASGIAPLLGHLLEQMAASPLPPAYLPDTARASAAAGPTDQSGSTPPGDEPAAAATEGDDE